LTGIKTEVSNYFRISRMVIQMVFILTTLESF